VLANCGVENRALMVLILTMKNVAKSSAVDEGGGEAGQRSEKNVLKSL